jgi:hypothetical protein
MERQQARSDSVLAGVQHSWSMSTIGEPVDAIASVPVNVIDAVGFDLSDDDDVLVVERVPGVDGDDRDPLLCIANEDASLGGRKRGRQSSDIWGLFTYDINPHRKKSADNTATNKKAWGLLQEMFPSRYFQGCTFHGLHLFVKDVFAAAKTKIAGQEVATYPDQYPFELMLEFVAGCKDVVKYFHNHHVAKAQLRELQLAAGAQVLARPAPTRLGTIKAICQTLLDSERHLHPVVSARDFVQGTGAQKAERLRVKEIVMHEEFVNNLKRALYILGPIDQLNLNTSPTRCLFLSCCPTSTPFPTRRQAHDIQHNHARRVRIRGCPDTAALPVHVRRCTRLELPARPASSRKRSAGGKPNQPGGIADPDTDR